MEENLIMDFVMHTFCISYFTESSAISLNLCNNVNTACGYAEAGSLLHFLKKGDGERSKFLYTTALDWVKKHVPAEVAKHLVDFSLGRDVFEQGKWVSFVKFGNEWGI
jgi:hypothetical protein